MQILPVLDLQNGLIVRGVGGRRQEYRPVVSRLVDSAAPVDVARAFRDRLGLSELYLADLDAIAGAAPALAVYQALHSLGCRLWVDAGVCTVADTAALAEAGLSKIVVGLETIAGPDELSPICRRLGRERVAFSLDLKNGQPLGNREAWGEAGALAIAEQAVSAGVGSLIVLDLARVGGQAGTGTDDLCRNLAAIFPRLYIVAGGGIRHADDLRRLRKCGVHAALVASALHDGAITAADLTELARPLNVS